MVEGVKITFESLFEIARREKDTQELQELPSSFLDDVVRYVGERKAMLDDAQSKSDVFSLAERDKLSVQLLNVRKIVRELWERRERKILDLVFTRVRTQSNIVDTSNLLSHEREVFELLVEALESGRSKVLHPVLDAKYSVPDAPEPHEDQTEAVEESDSKKVRFLSKVEPFVDAELQEYGPFEANDVVELPKDIADTLIESGQAVQV